MGAIGGTIVAHADSLLLWSFGTERLLGYPLLIAVCKVLFGAYWILGVVTVQFCVLGSVGLYIYRLMKNLSFSSLIRWAVLFAYGTGMYAYACRFIWVDGIYGLLCLLSIAVLIRACARLSVSRTDWALLFSSRLS
jgi:hypothetical protein